MSEFRQNPITKRWVLIAPTRGRKPEPLHKEESKALVEFDENCPFCPGNEYLNPDKCKDVCRLPENDAWQVRVIDNKFQALSSDVEYDRKGFYHAMSGYGEHELIIPRAHNHITAFKTKEDVFQLLEVVQSRIIAHTRDPKIMYTQIIYNHGKEAGASQPHPHFQIFSLPLVPDLVHDEQRACYHYFRDEGRCLYCDILKAEGRVKERIVFETDEFLVFAPFAARTPFETWILPKAHGPRFESINSVALRSLSGVMKDLLGRLYERVGDPALNFYIHTMPSFTAPHAYYEEASFHWHITVFPRQSLWAGFEFSTGIAINPLTPEDAALILR